VSYEGTCARLPLATSRVTHANGEVDIKVHDSPTQEVDAVVNVEADEALVIRRAIAGRYEERTSVPALNVSATRDGLVLTGVGCERRVIAWARRGLSKTADASAQASDTAANFDAGGLPR